MITKELIKDFPISKLKPYERNPRINNHAVDALAKSIKRVGNNDPIEITPNNIILCGHTRKKALEKLGIKTTDVIIISGMSEKQQIEYRITNNKTGELAEWDFEILEADFSSDELLDFGFDIKDLTRTEVEEDEAPPIPKIERTVKGDIYMLGNHRLMCGDSSILDNIEKLLNCEKPALCFTDPPYGVSIGKKNVMLNSFQKAGRNLTDIKNDELKPEDLKEVLIPIMSNMKIVCSEDCTYFVTAPQGGELGMMMMMMKESGLPIRHVLMWLKNSPTFSMGRLDYDYAHEPILLTWGKKHKSIMAGEQRTSVWRFDKPLKNKEHPTMKPVGLYVNALLNNSEPGDFAIDPFAGSGTMIIACEQTNRQAVCIELDEHYCDVIVQRWVNFTGGKVILNGKEIEWEKNNAAG
ncbi:MAG: DNA methyltransferase [Eubacteriales bacterium]|nr:DNA methyltransferase [Eubacteriales bacterium]